MPSWNSGYMTEVGYTFGYYRELAPSILRFAALNQRIAARNSQKLRYLELGFGQGVSFNIHAAATPGEYWGTDFNPAHALHAQELAAASGSGAQAFDLSFAELAARDDLPEFDIITLHGIWSWISAANRAVIVDLARRKLAPGGIFYISYNCLPGWTSGMPLRHLLTSLQGQTPSANQGIVGRIDGALAFAQRVIETDGLHFRANPNTKEKLKSLTTMSRSYLAHEYFNEDWDIMYYSQVNKILAEAKLDFVGSAVLHDHMNLGFNPAALDMLREIRQPVVRETVRDFIINQQFRRDIYVRGAIPLSSGAYGEQLARQGFVLTVCADDIKMKQPGGPFGEINLHAAIYQPLISILAERNYAPKTLEEIIRHPSWAANGTTAAIEALTILAGNSIVHPVQDEQMIALALPRCRALNQHICQKSRFGDHIATLASPVTGGGVAVARFPQLFLLALQDGRVDPAGWAAYAWDIIRVQGQRLVSEGKELASAEENLALLNSMAQEFAIKSLPVLRALRVAD